LSPQSQKFSPGLLITMLSTRAAGAVGRGCPAGQTQISPALGCGKITCPKYQVFALKGMFTLVVEITPGLQSNCSVVKAVPVELLTTVKRLLPSSWLTAPNQKDGA